MIQSGEIEEDRFGFEPEITAKVARAGWRLYEVGISYSGRTYAEGKKNCILHYSPARQRRLGRRHASTQSARAGGG